MNRVELPELKDDRSDGRSLRLSPRLTSAVSVNAVADTQKDGSGAVFHHVEVEDGRVEVGSVLTASADDRLTRVGRVITDFKLDELPQLWNVVRGDMSLVGPRPEDPAFVRDHWDSFEPILRVKPGITGLCQLAFAKESQILDPDDRMRDYVQRLLPAKIRIDLLYASRRSVGFDVRIALWTVAAVVLRRDVAVNRQTGRLTIRRSQQEHAATSG